MSNNKKLAVNVSLLSKCTEGKRALVLTKPPSCTSALIKGTEYHLQSFFDVIICENDPDLLALQMVDFFIYASDSAYLNSVLEIENLCSKRDDTIFCTNYNAIEQVKKLNRSVSTNNVNFLPSLQAPSSQAALERGVKCGLSRSDPGEHLAMIMGCEEIFVDPQDLKGFMEEPTERKPNTLTSNLPKNITCLNRRAVYKVLF